MSIRFVWASCEKKCSTFSPLGHTKAFGIFLKVTNITFEFPNEKNLCVHFWIGHQLGAKYKKEFSCVSLYILLVQKNSKSNVGNFIRKLIFLKYIMTLVLMVVISKIGNVKYCTLPLVFSFFSFINCFLFLSNNWLPYIITRTLCGRSLILWGKMHLKFRSWN